MKIVSFFILLPFQIRFVPYQVMRGKNHKTVSGWNLIFDLSHLMHKLLWYESSHLFQFCTRWLWYCHPISEDAQTWKITYIVKSALPLHAMQKNVRSRWWRKSWKINWIDRNVIFGWFINSGPIIRILWRDIIMIAIIIGIRKFPLCHHRHRGNFQVLKCR